MLKILLIVGLKVLTKLSQKEIILNHLKKYGSITSLECVYKYRIVDLQHAIHLLRKEYTITDVWEKPKDESGYSNRYKVYTLVEN